MFMVSIQNKFRLDEKIGGRTKAPAHTLYQTVMESFGASMIVLCLLDFGRLWLGITLTIPGKMYYLYQKGM
jgi:hypothetical protein